MFWEERRKHLKFNLIGSSAHPQNEGAVPSGQARSPNFFPVEKAVLGDGRCGGSLSAAYTIEHRLSS